MSQLFGPAHQLGYVVRDIESAMHHWTEVMHIGPFYYIDRVPLVELRYKGEPGCVQSSIALTYSGEMQIELIQQRDDQPSAFRDFLAAGNEGLHHIGFLSDRYDSDLQRATEAGMRIEQSGIVGSPGTRFTYFASAGHPGTMLKLTSLGACNRDLYRMIRKEAQRWDGSGPVRRLEP
jgi:hypothetical protein